METTAISRTIDELGRIVLPNQLRRQADWRAGDTILISYDEENGTAILRMSKNYDNNNIFDSVLSL